MKEIKPCPFCGGRAVVDQHPLNGALYISPIHKKTCPFQSLDSWLISDKPIKKQIKLWNRRESHYEKTLKKVVKDLENEKKAYARLRIEEATRSQRHFSEYMANEAAIEDMKRHLDGWTKRKGSEND